MELISLNSSFQGGHLVENYQSLIWTERYNKAGDFQVDSSNIAETIAALPLESYVTLRDSSVPMMVEWYTIEKKPNQAPTIKVTGRSFEACALERRASVISPLGPGLTRAAWTINATKQSDAAYMAMRFVLGDILRTPPVVTPLPPLSPAISALDAIPEISLTLPADFGAPAWSAVITYAHYDIVFLSGIYYIATAAGGNLNQTPISNPTYWTVLVNAYEIAPGILYNTVLELLVANNRGIKSVRPLPGDTQVGVEIYNGANLTDSVVFDARFDQFDDAKYLLGKQGSANVGYVYGSGISAEVLKTTAPEPSGLNRRVLLVDDTSDATVSTPDVLKSRGLIALYQNNETSLFDGEVAIQVANGYNKTYFLGDILKLVGEYGLTENVRVTEFIRSSDNTGEKSYPTFEAIIQ